MYLIKRITKICKFERMLGCFVPLGWGKGEGFNSLNEKIPSRNSTPHTHTPELLLCFYFEENNSMRHMGALNLVCNHSNLRKLNSQRRVIHTSALRFVCVFVTRVWRTNAWGTRACVWYPHVCGTCTRARVCTCVQNMTRAHMKM